MKTTANVANNSIGENLSTQNLEKEIYKPVKGFEGFYEVSNLGNVKSLPRNGTIKLEKILKIQNNDKVKDRCQLVTIVC